MVLVSCRWRSGRPSHTPRTPRSSTSGTYTGTSLSSSLALSCSPGCSTAGRTRRFPWSSGRKIFCKNLGPENILIKTHRVAFSTRGSETSFLDVVLAVVRGGDQVDKVGVLVVLEPGELRHQHSSSVLPLLFHLMSSVKLFLQHRSDLKIDKFYQTVIF